MVTKLKNYKIVKVSVLLLLFLSNFFFHASCIWKTSITGDAMWQYTTKLVQDYQCAIRMEIISALILLVVWVVLLVQIEPFVNLKIVFVAIACTVILLGGFFFYQMHFFAFPIWYEKNLWYGIFGYSFLNSLFLLPFIILFTKLMKSIPRGILYLGKRKADIENEDQRIAIEKMRQDLLANISHDLRTPLTSIISYIDILKNEELSENVAEYVEIIDRKANGLRRLVDDVVFLSKLTSHNMEAKIERINIKRFLDQVLCEWELDEDSLFQQVNYISSDAEAYVETDGSKLYRVFHNLIENAIKYKKEDSLIQIKYEHKEKECVFIEIKNEASYPLQFQGQEMVERFVRADKARNSEGHGLGLAIADELIKLCGGQMEIWVQDSYFVVDLIFDCTTV